MNIELRWLVVQTSEGYFEPARLQFRTCQIEPHWGEWEDVETEVVMEEGRDDR